MPSSAPCATGDGAPAVDLPIGLLAELSHRCPLRCPYCSNPTELERAGTELDTATWQRVFREAADLGVLQLHLSGGEPTVRRDLDDLIATAAEVGMYTNLITSAVLLDEARVARLRDAGLDHVQISIQGAEVAAADRMAGFEGAHAKKMQAARWVRAAGLPLTINAVIHRQNVEQLAEIIDLAVRLDADRLEVAHTQYYGWALENRAALMPTRDQVEWADNLVTTAQRALEGTLGIDYVVPDYYAERPKACMGGWGRRFLTISPSGKVLPCHAADSITTLTFDRVTERSLAEIWRHGDAFTAYRGTDWMPEPCQSCAFKEHDWGGCRCQAFALTGDAANTDPACSLSPHHAQMQALAEETTSDFEYRGYRRKKELENV